MSEPERPLPGHLARQPELDTWLRIDADGTVTLCTGKVELGQGLKTAIARIGAEELDVSLARIRVETADSAHGPNEFMTVGSMSIEESGTAMRLVAAEARQHLLELAAQRLRVPVGRPRGRRRHGARARRGPTREHDLLGAARRPRLRARRDGRGRREAARGAPHRRQAGPAHRPARQADRRRVPAGPRARGSAVRSRPATAEPGRAARRARRRAGARAAGRARGRARRLASSAWSPSARSRRCARASGSRRTRAGARRRRCPDTSDALRAPAARSRARAFRVVDGTPAREPVPAYVARRRRAHDARARATCAPTRCTRRSVRRRRSRSWTATCSRSGRTARASPIAAPRARAALGVDRRARARDPRRRAGLLRPQRRRRRRARRRAAGARGARARRCSCSGRARTSTLGAVRPGDGDRPAREPRRARPPARLEPRRLRATRTWAARFPRGERSAWSRPGTASPPLPPIRSEPRLEPHAASTATPIRSTRFRSAHRQALRREHAAARLVDARPRRLRERLRDRVVHGRARARGGRRSARVPARAPRRPARARGARGRGRARRLARGRRANGRGQGLGFARYKNPKCYAAVVVERRGRRCETARSPRSAR